jgi:2'-5' RNA ligase
MGQFAALLFDDAADAAIRGAWEALAAAGICRTMLAPGIRPHLTLAAGSGFDAPLVLESLGTIAAETPPFRLGLSSLGVFADTGVAFLGVTPIAALFDLHRRVDAACAAIADGLDNWYRPDGWVPHVTLAFPLDAAGVAAAVRLLAGRKLKLSAEARSIAFGEGDGSGWTIHGTCPLSGPGTPR